MTSGGFDPHIRPINIRNDLEKIANLIETAFAGQMDTEGRDYLRHIRQIAHGLGAYLIDGDTPETSQFPFHGYLWEEDRRIVGNLTLIPIRKQDAFTYFIANVAVHPDYRGKGIARQLTDRAIAHVKDRQGKRIYLQVKVDNAVAYHIYQKAGFEQVDSRTSWIYPQKHRFSTIPTHSVQVTRRREADWSQQKAWLDVLYPAEISWNLPYDVNRLKPDLLVKLTNFLNGASSRSWAARENDHLIGIASLESGFSSSDYIWLATSPVWEDQAIRTLVPEILKHAFRTQRIMINFPYRRGVDAFTDCGLQVLNTLIWMKMDLHPDPN